MTGDRLPLDGLLVGVSVSSSPDLGAFGLDTVHLDHAFLELARQLLAAGADLAFGGDLRARGFTESLVDLLHTYPAGNRPGRERVFEYLAWPLRAEQMIDDADRQRLAGLRNVATVVTVEAPARLPEHVPNDLRERLFDAESFTLMRQRMTADIDARILLGGQLAGFKGRFPGIAEEALLAVRAGRPVYILGGFGGCARRLAALVSGGRPPDLNVEILRSQDPEYAQLVSFLPDVDDETLTVPLRQAGVAGLRNGLSSSENQVLFESADIDQVVALVLRGLRRVASPTKI